MAEIETSGIHISGTTGGDAHIRGHRIRVMDVAIWHEKMGMTPDEIVDQFPTVTLAEVYAALSYYWDHRESVEAAISAERALTEAFQRDAISPLERKLGSVPRGSNPVPVRRARSARPG